MLKKLGTELEFLDVSAKSFIQRLKKLEKGLGQSLKIQRCYYSWLLPKQLEYLLKLELSLPSKANQGVSFALVDEEFIEINLPGFWISDNIDPEEGLFITVLEPSLEEFLYHIWSTTQKKVLF